MSLDVPTLVLAVALVTFELGIAFILVGRMLGKQPGLGPWVLCAACIAGGALLWVLRVVLPGPAFALVGPALQFAGFAFCWAGAREFCGKARSLWPFRWTVGPFLAALAWFSLVMPSTRARVTVMALSVGCWCLAIAWTFFRHGPVHLRASTRIAAAAFLLHGAFSFARIFFPQHGLALGDVLQTGWPHAATALEILLSSTVLFLALIAVLAHRLMADLRHAARTDGLTGVYNRRALESEGARAVKLCITMGLPCAVLLLDLDHFKLVNDTLGHLAGDAVLRHVASLVGSTLRRSDIFGRYGGEEFVAIMPGAGGDDARAAAERIRALVARTPAEFEGASVPQTISIGFAWGAGAELDYGTLVTSADAGLYRAKGSGRNRVIEAAA